MFHAINARAADLILKRIIAGRARRYRAHSPRLAAIPNEHIGVAIASEGLYERAEIELIRRLIAERGLGGTVMLDIGANIGNHSCALAPHVGEIVAFEPNPPIAALLRANILLNDLANVRVAEVGLGSEDAELPFGVSEDGNDGTGSFARGGSRATLPVRRGDEFLAEIDPRIGNGDKRIGFVKCDVEGFEAQVFAGLQATLARHRPVVMFESGSRVLGDAAWHWLRKAGYARLEAVTHAGDGAGGRLIREARRLLGGDLCSTQPIAGAPERECNLIALPD